MSFFLRKTTVVGAPKKPPETVILHKKNDVFGRALHGIGLGGRFGGAAPLRLLGWASTRSKNRSIDLSTLDQSIDLVIEFLFVTALIHEVARVR